MDFTSIQESHVFAFYFIVTLPYLLTKLFAKKLDQKQLFAKKLAKTDVFTAD